MVLFFLQTWIESNEKYTFKLIKLILIALEMPEIWHNNLKKYYRIAEPNLYIFF